MDVLQTLSATFSLSVTSGINLYATVLVVGLSIRYGVVDDAPAVFNVLASWPVIITAGILYVVEFFADKVPLVEHAWDLVHTLIRPVGAAIIGFAAVGDIAPEFAVIAAMVSGSAALVSHGGKAGSRVAMSISSPLENITDIIISILEDLAVAVLAVVALKAPVFSAVITGIILILIIIFVPTLLRWAWFNMVAIWLAMKGLVRPKKQSEPIPDAHQSLLSFEPLLSMRCKAQNVRGVHGRTGYLSLNQDTLCFTYNRWRGGTRQWCLTKDQLVSTMLQQQLLMHTVTITYTTARGKEKVARFVVLKDREPLINHFLHHWQTFYSKPIASLPS